jgi:sugar/nucleoside kinase (ribokinase family)
MKHTLVVGSTCVDVTLDIPHFPSPGEDENISRQFLSLGGCAYNVSDILRKFRTPYLLCSPVGTGIYGKFVETNLAAKNIPVFAHIPTEDNGCCYCIIDATGNRTFLSRHGAEYKFRKEWFTTIKWDEIDSIYFCGLEVEDVNGEELVSFMEDRREFFDNKNLDVTFFFAPGPRIMKIDRSLIKRVFSIKPVVHLNETEAAGLTGVGSTEEAARMIHSETCNSVIITRSEKGAYCFDHTLLKGFRIDGYPAKVTDSTGAGDAHCGTVIAGLKQGFDLTDAVVRANKLASLLVTVHGSTLSDESFNGYFPRRE